jgi:hypothetical protein
MRRFPVLAALLLSACGGSSSPTSPATSPAPAASPSAPAAPMIGAEGGTVTSADGRAVLRIPAGALSRPVAVTLSAAFVTLDAFAASPAYVVGPANTQFSSPAELTIAGAADDGPLGADPAGFRLHVLEGAASWRAVSGVGASGTYKLRWTGPPTNCNSAEDRQFDFWLGNWNYVVNGSVVAPNTITRDPNGCVIHEFYAGGSGVSISFRGTDGAWYQTYVSNSAPIRMRGGLEGRRMVMYGAAGGGVRFVWDPVTPDRVLYVVERSTDGGATWTVAGPSEYVRR